MAIRHCFRSFFLESLRLRPLLGFAMLLSFDHLALQIFLEAFLPLVEALGHSLELLIILEELGKFRMVVDLHLSRYVLEFSSHLECPHHPA